MNTYYAVLAAALVGAIVVVAVHLVLTLIQVRHTAREVELLARKANGEMDKVGSVTAAVSGLVGGLGGSTGRLMAGAANLAIHLIRRYKRGKPVDVADEEEEKKGEDA